MSRLRTLPPATLMRVRRSSTVRLVSTPVRHCDRDPQTYRVCNLNPYAPDIREAIRAAVRNMIAFLSAEHGLSAVDAYMLCSVAGDLRMHEVVSAGVTTVHVTGVHDLAASSVRLTCRIMWYVVCKRSCCGDDGLTLTLSPDWYDVH